MANMVSTTEIAATASDRLIQVRLLSLAEEYSLSIVELGAFLKRLQFLSIQDLRTLLNTPEIQNMPHDTGNMENPCRDSEIIALQHKQLERLAKDIQYAQYVRVRHEREAEALKLRSEKLSALLEEWENLRTRGYPVEGYDLNESGKDPIWNGIKKGLTNEG